MIRTLVNILRYIFFSKWLVLVYLVTFLVIAPLMSSRMPFSKFYHLFNADGTISEQANSLNSARLKEAKQYFKRLDTKISKDFYSKNNELGLDLVIAIVTVNRQSSDGYELGYLTQTVAMMDKLVKLDKFFRHKVLFICNVDRKPDSHSEANSLASYLPFVNRYGNHSFPFRELTNEVRSHYYKTANHYSKYEKETVDYRFCLETANSLNPEYVLLMEDDTLPYDNIFEVLKYNIDNRVHHVNENGKVMQSPFAYIKLYYPQRWQGYANEILRLTELFSVTCFGAGLFLLIYFVCCIKFRNSGQYTAIFISGAIYTLILVSLIGRQNMMELRRLSKYLYTFRSSPGCCTQAMLYPKQIIPKLLNYLGGVQTTDKFHTDIAIYNFVKSTNIPAYQIEPNLFHHIGMYTSLNSKGPKKAEEFIFKVKI